MPGGRPSKYDASYAELAKRCCLAFGSTDEELARFFDVSVATISNWNNAHPEFLEALNDTKRSADAKVIQKLYHRATGYSHEAVKIFMTNDGPVKVPYIEHYPPDTTACIFWLKNRQPEAWRERVEHSGTDGKPLFEFTLNIGRPAAPVLISDRAKEIEHIDDELSSQCWEADLHLRVSATEAVS